MTELFEKLKAKLATLPEEEQRRWILRFLEELARGERSSSEPQTFVKGWIGGSEATFAETMDAGKRLQEFRKGITLSDDITIKELINEGRRDLG
jgi:hypothetical protein